MQHDLSLRRCLSVFLGVVMPESWNIASLPLSLGGWGFSAPIEVGAANWAS